MLANNVIENKVLIVAISVLQGDWVLSSMTVSRKEHSEIIILFIKQQGVEKKKS